MDKNQVQSFRKIGGGSLRFKGRIIKPNQVFQADPQELPTAFRNFLVPIEGGAHLAQVSPLKGDGKSLKRTIPVKKEKLPPPPIVYELKSAKGGWWNVINKTTGKPINDKRLRKEDAESLIEALALLP